MEHDLIIDTEQGIILETYMGQMDMSFVHSCMQKVSEHPDFDPNFPIIVDLREAKAPYKLSPFLDELPQLHDETFEPGSYRTAILVEDPVLTALTYGFSEEVSSRKLKVFSTMEACLDWCLFEQSY